MLSPATDEPSNPPPPLSSPPPASATIAGSLLTTARRAAWCWRRSFAWRNAAFASSDSSSSTSLGRRATAPKADLSPGCSEAALVAADGGGVGGVAAGDPERSDGCGTVCRRRACERAASAQSEDEGFRGARKLATAKSRVGRARKNQKALSFPHMRRRAVGCSGTTRVILAKGEH